MSLCHRPSERKVSQVLASLTATLTSPLSSPQSFPPLQLKFPYARVSLSSAADPEYTRRLPIDLAPILPILETAKLSIQQPASAISASPKTKTNNPCSHEDCLRRRLPAYYHKCDQD